MKTLFVVAATLTLTGRLAAQDSLARGDRIRLTAPAVGAYQREATFISRSAQSVTLKFDGAADTQVVAMTGLTRLEVSDGGNRETTAKIGAAVGALAGIAAYAITPWTGRGHCDPSAEWVRCAESVLLDQQIRWSISMAAGTLVGAGIGYLAGHAAGWRAVGTQVKPVITFEKGRPGAGFSVAF